MSDTKISALPTPEPEPEKEEVPITVGVDIAGVFVPGNTTTWTSTGTSAGWGNTNPITVNPTTTTTLEVKTLPAVEEEKKTPPPKIVAFPTRVTRKVVVGFVEDDDEIVWGAKLYISEFNVDYDTHGDGRITLVMDIWDADEQPEK